MSKIHVSAALLGLSVLWFSWQSWAQPAAEESPASTVSIADMPELRAQMQSHMEKIGKQFTEAKKVGDFVRMACVRDKQQGAQQVVELATVELLIVNDSNAKMEARSFAAEKFAAAEQRMGNLANEAIACDGESSPEVENRETKTDCIEPQTIPVNNPTSIPLDNPVPPPLDADWLPVISPTS